MSKLTTCPQCGNEHEAKFESNRNKAGWFVWCDVSMKSRRVMNPKHKGKGEDTQ